MKFPFLKIKGFEANIQPEGDLSAEFYTKRKIYEKPKSFKYYNDLAAEFGKEMCEELTQFDYSDVPTATIILIIIGIISKREIEVPLVHIRWLGSKIFIFDKIGD